MVRALGLLAVFGCVCAPGQELRQVEPSYGHLLYLPKGMWAAHTRWPLVLYLHGKSLRGSDLSRVSAYGLPQRLKSDKHFPFIVLAPQLPAGERWTNTKVLWKLVDEAAKLYPVDRRRIYAVGFSMGASGVWRVAHAYPGLFAAMVSVGGTYEKALAADGRLKSLPVWLVHGSADKEASPEVAREIVQLHKRNGGRGSLTLLPGKGHDIPQVTADGKVFHWLLNFRSGN